MPYIYIFKLRVYTVYVQNYPARVSIREPWYCITSL